jgi:YesN/AraC family two-component response regulator
MMSTNLTQVTEKSATSPPETILERADFCMKHYQPYLRKDFNLDHLSSILNISKQALDLFFRQSHLPFDQYLEKWRVLHAKGILEKYAARDLEIKTIGSLSGFSSERKFVEAFKKIEGISPEIYQSQINESK